ncbi:predicted protein [Streptomyces sp. AA4]|nr:predicted protein [Streptomyces sp. AA4]
MRGAEEILATLDKQGRMDGLPFMPEMLRFAGQEMRVYKRAGKTCDTITPSTDHRKLERTVHLAGARCDGSAHGGCQAACLLFFREEWLEPAPEPAGPAEATVETLTADTIAPPDEDGVERYRCQATELLNASAPLSAYSPGQYLEDIRSGNEKPAVVLRGLLVVLFNKFQRLSTRLPARLRIRGGETYPFLRGTGPSGPKPEPLRLEPGELVEVRSKEEILRTLSPENKNRGMLFDVEMLPYCGQRARVLHRVERIIDEKTGRMLRLRDCVVLEDVFCRSLYHRFCPRAIYPYWREAWLRRVEG